MFRIDIVRKVFCQLKCWLMKVLNGILVISVIVRLLNIMVMVEVVFFFVIRLVVIVELIEKNMLCVRLVSSCVRISVLQFGVCQVSILFVVNRIINVSSSCLCGICLVNVVSIGVLIVMFSVQIEISSFVEGREIESC